MLQSPGILLPEQIAALRGAHHNLNQDQLFRKYLIAELFTPHIGSVPAFVLSPVTMSANGRRQPDYLTHHGGSVAGKQHCIPRDNLTRSCTTHACKPFGCDLLICAKMTKAKAILLNGLQA